MSHIAGLVDYYTLLCFPKLIGVRLLNLCQQYTAASLFFKPP